MATSPRWEVVNQDQTDIVKVQAPTQTELGNKRMTAQVFVSMLKKLGMDPASAEVITEVIDTAAHAVTVKRSAAGSVSMGSGGNTTKTDQMEVEETMGKDKMNIIMSIVNHQAQVLGVKSEEMLHMILERMIEAKKTKKTAAGAMEEVPMLPEHLQGREILQFGKYKGKTFEEAKNIKGYAKWCLTHATMLIHAQVPRFLAFLKQNTAIADKEVVMIKQEDGTIEATTIEQSHREAQSSKEVSIDPASQKAIVALLLEILMD